MSARLALTAGTLAAAGAAAAEGAAYAARRREIDALRERCRAARALALTYDDGPSAGLTPRLLDLLAAHGARATFFALGRRVGQAPAVLDRVRADGHEIGCHTFHHRHAWKSAPWTAQADVDAGYAALAPWVAPDGPFRPPHGKQTTLTRRALRRRGAPVGWWTIDSGDTHARLPDPGDVVSAVVGDGGGVVLMHDHDDARPTERQDYVATVTALLLAAARAHGLSVRPLGEIGHTSPTGLP